MFKAWFIKIPIDLHIQNSYLRPKQGVSITAIMMYATAMNQKATQVPKAHLIFDFPTPISIQNVKHKMKSTQFLILCIVSD